jgi:hypothetical protein
MTQRTRVDELESKFGAPFLTSYRRWRDAGELPENVEHVDLLLKLEAFLAEANLSMEGTDPNDTPFEREQREAPLLAQIQLCEDARGEPGHKRDVARAALGAQQRESAAAARERLRASGNLPIGDEDLPAPRSPD